MGWDELESAFAAGDTAAALEIALADWRKRKSAPLADVIDFLSTRLGPPAITAHRLLDKIQTPSRTVWERGTIAERYKAWLERVAALPDDDPRIAHVLMDSIIRAPWHVAWPEDAAVLIQPALDLIVHIGDVRCATRLRALLAHPEAERTYTRHFLATALPETIAKLPEVPLDPNDVARAGKLLHAEKEAALFEMVAANPIDDGPRQVLVDHWLERDHPRGHFATAASKKRWQLLNRHEAEWLGDLAVVTNHRRYRGAFLDGFGLERKRIADAKVWASALRNPNLATVRTVRGTQNEEMYVAFVYAIPSLEELDVISDDMFQKVRARKEPWLVRRLILRVRNAKSADLPPAVFPNVAEVGLSFRNRGDGLMSTANALRPRFRVFGCGWLEDLDRTAEFLTTIEGGIRYGSDERPAYLVVRENRLELDGEFLPRPIELIAALRKRHAIDQLVLRIPSSAKAPAVHWLTELRNAKQIIEIVADAKWAKAL
jgi:hypothetical protein